ncbi:ISL3 family transposase [Kitasatospora cathayae]|uniref:ISL3 family transposase n=1 Tax=Kitasatospora cathayae TaxID=3004092 RepID=A0ABY7QGZ4_9ACTN|nr:ISL3 family transposase [Kitasatospora sp. HUAS 3-15]WBP92084.1 ISL3 family transposase [Kitasatospora sp. HUAS 3-15]
MPHLKVPSDRIRVLGVDDFALRKGDSYATILVDLERRRPVDVLPGRDAEPLAVWLKGHPEVEIICRDRAGAYAEGARSGAPQAVQVADAWHLWHNLGEAVEKTVSSHHACVRTVFENTVSAAPPTSDDIWLTSPPPVPAAGMLDVCGRERRLVTRTRERYTAVRQLLDGGSTLENICRTLQLDRSTVRRFVRATGIDELLVKATNRSTILDKYKPYLHQRWNEGCHNTAELHQEIVTMCFAGSIQTVRGYLRSFKAAIAAPPVPRPAPRPRRIVRWIMSDPANLTADDAVDLKEIRAGCPELDAVAHHVRDFAAMMRDLRGDRLPAWIERVLADDLPALHSLAKGLSRDIDAATAGLSTPWSSGQVEGQVTRAKLLKRQGFGRSNLDFLRKRILLSP